MPSTTLKRALTVAIALASFVFSSPASAAPVSLRSFAQENLQVATIAYRISTQTAADCREPQMVTGLLLHDLSLYDRNVRPAVARAFSLGTGIGITEVVAGSAAQRAGLRTDDEIVSVNGVSVEEPGAVDGSRRSYRRLERFSKDLQRALRNGPVELAIRRSGTVVRTSLSGQPGCGGDLFLSSSRKRTAWSDGSQVVITTAMMQLARSDDGLAFVVAHEMAHNILGHSTSARRGIFGLRFGGKREELAADYMAVWMMTEGGYKAEGGLNFLRTVQRRLWWNISLNHPSFGRRIKTVAGAITSAANSPTWARAHPELVTAAPGGDPLAGARACGGAGAAPCATSAALSRTGDRVSVALGKLDKPQEIAPETLSPQPGQAAPPAILRTVPGVALDVPAPGPVQRSEPPEAVSAIHADAKMATGGLRLSEAPVAEQPESNGAPSPTQIVGAAERSVLPRLAPAATLMFEPNPLQPNHLGATAAMPDQLLVAGSAFATSHSSLPPDRGVAGGHGSGSRECAIPVAQGGAGIAAWY